MFLAFRLVVVPLQVSKVALDDIILKGSLILLLLLLLLLLIIIIIHINSSRCLHSRQMFLQRDVLLRQVRVIDVLR